jgi:hypothetical protein
MAPNSVSFWRIVIFGFLCSIVYATLACEPMGRPAHGKARAYEPVGAGFGHRGGYDKRNQCALRKVNLDVF